jgi:PPOX class probable F420-dependent enzyme
MVRVVGTGSGWAREQFLAARVARLATSDVRGLPHVVPIVFAVDGDTIFTAVDTKPKSGAPLRRLANIAANPRVSVLVDHYEDDWTRLWWARADGEARILSVDDSMVRLGLEALVSRYPQYSTDPPPGPVVAITVARWSGWRSADRDRYGRTD